MFEAEITILPLDPDSDSPEFIQTHVGIVYPMPNGTINLHGFGNITEGTKVTFYIIEDDGALVIAPDDTLGDGEYIQLDKYTRINASLIDFPKQHDSFYSLFVRDDYRWVQVNGVKNRETQRKSRFPAPKKGPGAGNTFS